MEQTYGLEIHPDGTVVRHPAPFGLEEAERIIGSGVDVAMCPDRQHVIVVGEHSTLLNAPANVTAWLCYGRSLLCGVACLWHDRKEPLWPALVTMVEQVGAEVAEGDRETAQAHAAAFWNAVGVRG